MAGRYYAFKEAIDEAIELLGEECSQLDKAFSAGCSDGYNTSFERYKYDTYESK